jgi:hypothetical protein
MQNESAIASLPLDVWGVIITHLDLVSLISVSSTSNCFHEIATEIWDRLSSSTGPITQYALNSFPFFPYSEVELALALAWQEQVVPDAAQGASFREEPRRI